MNTKEALFKSLLDNDRIEFSKIAIKRFEEKLEEMIWEHYQEIEDELKEKMASYRKSQVDD